MKRLLLALLLVLFAGPAFAGNVGFRVVEVTGGPAPLKVGLWYPTKAPMAETKLGLMTQVVAQGAPLDGAKLPLVVISHGAGGWFGSHIDTARALAADGYVVAAPSHAGDTYDDRSATTRPWIRTLQVRQVIDYMLADWSDHAAIDPDRIGLFGFSAGGLTGVAAIGGAPDMSLMAPHCRAHPDFYDCKLIARAGLDLAKVPAPPRDVWLADRRIRAAVIAAPALGFVFRNGLKDVTVPVQLWQAEHDQVLPETEAQPLYALVVRDALPAKPEYHLVREANHYDFLAPCTAAFAAQEQTACFSRPGFDRAAFHKTLNAEVARFFDRTLR